jgi:hypothetical protein
MRIVLVEDDAMIGDVVLDTLRAEHYAVDWVKDGAMAQSVLVGRSLRHVKSTSGRHTIAAFIGLTVARCLNSLSFVRSLSVCPARASRPWRGNWGGGWNCRWSIRTR